MGAIVWNIMVIILYNVVKFGGLVKEQLISLWVCLGCDIYFVFQGHCIGVISQIKKNNVFSSMVCTMWHTKLIWMSLFC
jgi:hypothetical protein